MTDQRNSSGYYHVLFSHHICLLDCPKRFARVKHEVISFAEKYKKLELQVRKVPEPTIKAKKDMKMQIL